MKYTNIKTSIVILAVILLNILFLTKIPQTVTAQSQDDESGGQVDLDDVTTFEIDKKIGLESITIPFFGQPDLAVDEYATAISYVSFVGNLVTVAAFLYWVFKGIKIGSLIALHAEDDTIYEQAIVKVKALLRGIGMTFIFPIVISILGAVVGAGPAWNWPSAFRSCPGAEEHTFYFQAVLAADADEEDAQAYAELLCFGGSEGIELTPEAEEQLEQIFREETQDEETSDEQPASNEELPTDFDNPSTEVFPSVTD